MEFIIVPYIQHTDDDRNKMLEAIGVNDIDALFECIPDSVRFMGSLDLPDGLSEMEVTEQLKALGSRNRPAGSRPAFLGAGSYQHFIPSLVDHLGGRAEFVTAYTPYQPELSQGALQAFFEYQTMFCMLTDLEISNASMYDGASALAEGALMALDITRRKRLLVSQAVHPEYRAVLATYLGHLDVEIVELPHKEGRTDWTGLENRLEGAAAVLCQNPNFFGCVEDLAAPLKAAKSHGVLSVVSVDPVSLSILKPPGTLGADLATGEGQSLGVPMSYGGPGFGFLACRMEQVRRVPGRIVGQTVDRHGNPSYVLTFQTREQHIRRERATSNICTNNALVAMRSLLYLSALGSQGFRALGRIITAKAHAAAKKIAGLKGFDLAYGTPFFQEFVLRCPLPAEQVNAALLEEDMIGGYALGRDYPRMDRDLMLCITETTTDNDVDRLVGVLKGI